VYVINAPDILFYFLRHIIIPPHLLLPTFISLTALKVQEIMSPRFVMDVAWMIYGLF